MKPKHNNCLNCGANDYRQISHYEYECTYCGTVYEAERKSNIPMPIAFPIASTVAMTSMGYIYGGPVYGTKKR